MFSGGSHTDRSSDIHWTDSLDSHEGGGMMVRNDSRGGHPRQASSPVPGLI